MSTLKISRRFGFLVSLTAIAALLLASASLASAAPKWRIDSLANTHVAAGSEFTYRIQLTNVGDVATDGSQFEAPIELPAGITGVSWAPGTGPDSGSLECTGPGATPVAGQSLITCTSAAMISPNNAVQGIATVLLRAAVDPAASGILTAAMRVSGGGAPEPDITLDPTRIAPTPPSYGIDAFDVAATKPDGSLFTQAGGHPYAFTTSFDFPTATSTNPFLGDYTPVESSRDVIADLPPGFVGNPSALATCTTAELANAEGVIPKPRCPAPSQVGIALIGINNPIYSGAYGPVPVFNLDPALGAPASFGFNLAGTVVPLHPRLRSSGDYGLSIDARKIPEGLNVAATKITFWGDPGDESHRLERSCPGQNNAWAGGATCPGASGSKPFFRMPTSCPADPADGLDFRMALDSWEHPASFRVDGEPDLSDPNWHVSSVASHEPPGYPANPEDPSTPWGKEKGVTGCDLVPVKGNLKAQTTAIETSTPSGLDVHVEIPNPGFENIKGIASSDIKGVKVTLPEGVNVNPSQAEGLGVCSPARYASTKLSFHPDGTTGCPSDSKIGTVAVTTPLLEETLEGSVYIATPFENPFNSLLALYVVIENPERGILIKLPAKVSTDGRTGQITTDFQDLPQMPFSTFDFHFRQGARAPLVTPPACGTYTTEAEFTGHSDPNGAPVKSTSSFQITRGIGGSPCPPDGVPGFDPGFSAGTLNNNAGSFSPTIMRLTRRDGEQNLTKFSAVLPEGLLAKLAGVSWCPDASIAAAKGKSGKAELASPSCPANSKIGRSLAGAGVGSVLTYVPGSLYLAGPYNGAPLSVVAITPAVAGPFDVGTVVVREGLALDPVTGVASVDGAASDPIPHILKGIPLKLRDLRVYVDRPEFTINPTSCDPDQIGATLWGSAADVFSPADDQAVGRSSRFQAANCLNLGFKPKLKINLRGATKRGKFPALRAVLTPRPGDANLERAAVVLPSSAFLEQGHIRTICTRVQYAAGAGHGSECPQGSQYGFARAWSPLLDQPLQGPVYLRSSSNKLPDMVLALKGIVDIEAVGRIDSVKLRGGGSGIRSLFASVPDAPLSRVVLDMQGGRKGLIVNSRNLCRGKNRARSNLTGQNGRRDFTRPIVRSTGCKKRRKAKRSSHSPASRARVAGASSVG